MFNLIAGGQGIGITGNDTISFVVQPGTYQLWLGDWTGGGNAWVLASPSTNIQLFLNGNQVITYGGQTTVTAPNSTFQFINVGGSGVLDGNPPCRLSITQLQ